jgi:GTP cyclohydrolase FolE2
MLAPTGDASYLISVYESTVSCAIVPTLRWIDENGVARSQ